MRLIGGSATHVGQVRDVNQDRGFFVEGLAVVADGMGGHAGGEVAASLVVEEFGRVDGVMPIDALCGLVEAANRRILSEAEELDLRGMGTTLVLAAISETDGIVHVLNVGDSRCYLVSDGEMSQVTVDHSLVEDMVRQGTLDPEEALSHPQRNIVTRVLGISENVEVDTFDVSVKPGDRLVLCSDGLSNELTGEQICYIASSGNDPSRLARELVAAALASGGRDNITVSLVIVEEGDPPPPAAVDVATDGPEPAVPVPPRDRSLWWKVVGSVVAVIAVVAISLLLMSRYARSAWYVDNKGGQVVILNGRPGGTLFWEPEVVESTGIEYDRLDGASRERLDSNPVWSSLDLARDMVSNLETIEDPGN